MAASEYRDAVHRFERAVLRARCFDFRDERLVDRLGDASTLLRIAARNPYEARRLRAIWNEIQPLQRLVGETILGHPRCPAGGDLVFAWDRVLIAGRLFAGRLALIPCTIPIYGTPIVPVYIFPGHHHHGHGHGDTETESVDATPLPYWHPSRTRYGQGLSTVPKTDRSFSAPPRPTQDVSAIRQLAPPSRIPTGVRIQRTPSPSTQRSISAPSPRSTDAGIGAKLMRR